LEPGQGASPGPHVEILRCFCFLGFGCACSLQGGVDDVPQDAGGGDDWISTTVPSLAIAGTATPAAWLTGTPKAPALPVAIPTATPTLISARHPSLPNSICTLRTFRFQGLISHPPHARGLDGPGKSMPRREDVSCQPAAIVAALAAR
jgi:hypothetical protein